jgi:hypothetical protein
VNYVEWFSVPLRGMASPRRLNGLYSPTLLFHFPSFPQFPLPPFAFLLITIADRTPPLHDRRATDARGRFTIPISSLMPIQLVDSSARS